MELHHHASYKRDNNFNLIRMAAAFAVMWSHAYFLSGGKTTPEPLSEFLPHYSLGRLAVWTFFIISGYFISQSFDRRRSLGDFLLARVLRIYPALIVSLCFTAFVIGPLVSSWNYHSYAADSTPYTFLLGNLSFYGRINTLPGVFETLPYPNAVNESLWTLRYELLCYLMVPAVGMIAGSSRLRFNLGVALYLAAHLCLSQWEVANRVAFSNHIMLHNLHELVYPFVIGMVFYRYRTHIHLHISGVVLSALLIGILHGNDYYRDLCMPLWAYCVMYIGLTPMHLRNFNRLGNCSYGVYIYAFPLQQAVLSYFPSAGVGELMLLSTPLTLMVASLSWRYVEKPSMALRYRTLPVSCLT